MPSSNKAGKDYSGSSWASFFANRSCSFSFSAVAETEEEQISASDSFLQQPAGETAKKEEQTRSDLAERVKKRICANNKQALIGSDSYFNRSISETGFNRSSCKNDGDDNRRRSEEEKKSDSFLYEESFFNYSQSPRHERAFLDSFGEGCLNTVKKMPVSCSSPKELSYERINRDTSPPKSSWVTCRKKEVYDDCFSAKSASPAEEDGQFDADDTFENFLAAMKTPAQEKSGKENGRLSSFVVSDSSDVENSPEFYLKSLSERITKKVPELHYIRTARPVSPLERSQSADGIIDLVSDDGIIDLLSDSDEDKGTHSRPASSNGAVLHFTPPPARKKITRKKGRIKTTTGAPAESESPATVQKEAHLPKSKTEPLLSFDSEFLRSLSPTVPSYRRHPDAERHVKNFKKNRVALVDKLYKMYNEKVFSDELPADMEITWNVRLTKTAGLCSYRKNSQGDRMARIELSDKVCDSSERVRDTLIHEMCHAAVWLLHGQKDGGHGKVWKLWAKKSVLVFPSLPLVTRCHSYQIRAKYTYRCGKCKQEIHRHSKSLDIQKKVCGICYGRFELVANSVKKPNGDRPASPKQPPKFALFVKENYGSVKKSGSGKTHKEIMGELGEQFKKKATL